MACQQSHVPWQNGKSAGQALNYLWMKPTLSDIKFVFPKEKDTDPIHAHKMVLSMRSAEFEKLFYGSSLSHSTIEIQDISRDIFQTFLRFLYTDEAIIEGKTVLSLLHTAQKYEVTTLIQKCGDFLENALSVENACLILGKASSYGMASLQMKALKFIEGKTLNVIQSNGYLTLSKEDLSLILQSDSLSANEVTVFNAVMKWSFEECGRQNLQASRENIRAVLGDILYDIRFPTMTSEEFTEHVADYGILTDQEQLDIFKYLSTKGEKRISRFNTKMRRGTTSSRRTGKMPSYYQRY